MGSSEPITQLIYRAIEEVNQTMPLEQALERSADTVLIGESGKLDSLGFVNLVATLEDKIESLCGRQISLIDIMTGDRDPQWTVGALANCLAGLFDGVERNQGRAQVSTQI
jgi:acyl carrier protein